MKLKRVSEGDLSENSTVVGGKWASYWVEAFMFMAWVTHQFVTTQRLQIRQGRGGGQLEVKMLLLSHTQLSNQPFSSVDLSHHQTCLREQREFYLRLYLTGNFNTWALAGVLDLSQIHERTSEDDWGANIHLEMFMLIIRIRPLLSFQLCSNAAGGVFFLTFFWEVTHLNAPPPPERWHPPEGWVLHEIKSKNALIETFKGFWVTLCSRWFSCWLR